MILIVFFTVKILTFIQIYCLLSDCNTLYFIQNTAILPYLLFRLIINYYRSIYYNLFGLINVY